MNKRETLNGETYSIEILCHAKIIKMPKEKGPGIPILDFVFASEREAKDAIKQTQGRRFILGTGCVVPVTASHENYTAVRKIIE